MNWRDADVQKRKRVQEGQRRQERKIEREALPFPVSGYDPRIHLIRSPTALIFIKEDKDASI